MTENDIIQQLRDMRYPHDIDVTDAVMAQVSKTPLLVAKPEPRFKVSHLVATVAACVAIVLTINITALYTHDYNEQSIGNMIAEVYNYHADYGELTASVSSYDFGAIEALYE